MICQLKSCRKCGGDLVLDVDEWRCWQCGQYYYPRRPRPEFLEPEAAAIMAEAVEETPRQRRSRRELRNINALIVAKDRSEERWWVKNHEVIKYLDEGRPVREIARLVDRGERQIRVIRERLHDLRFGRNAEGAA